MLSLPRSPTDPSSATWRMWAAGAIVAACFVPTNAPTPLYVRWQTELGLPTSFITILFAAYVVGLLVALPVAGQCSDRFGQRPVLLLGLSAATIACVIFVSAHLLAFLVVARLVSGVAAGSAATAGVELVVELGGAEPRMAPAVASSAVVFGAAVGPLLAGAIALIVEQPVTPIFLTIFVLLVGATALATRLPSRRHDGRTAERAFRFPTVPSEHRTYLVSGILSLGCSLSSTAFILSLGPSVLRHLAGETSPLVAGVMACAMFASGTLIQMPAMKLRPRWMFISSAATVVMAMAFIAAAVTERSASLMIAAAIAGGAGYGLAQLAGLTLIGLHVPPERRAEANAALNMGAYVPCGLVPIVVGVVVDSCGLYMGTIIFTSVLAVAAISACALIAPRVSHV